MFQICCSQRNIQLSINCCSGLTGGCVFVCFCVTQHLHGLSFSLHLSGVRRGSMEALFLMSSCECLRCLLKQHICTAEWRNCVLFLSACVHKRLFQQHPRIGAPLDADAVKWRVIWVTFATTKARLSEMISSWFQFQETALPSVSIIHLSVKQDVTLPSSDEVTWEISALHWLKSHQDPRTVARSLFFPAGSFFGWVISCSKMLSQKRILHASFILVQTFLQSYIQLQ